MKKLALVLALAALSGCVNPYSWFDRDAASSQTYHITCFSGGKVVYETEASNLYMQGVYTRFRDEDGEQVQMNNSACIIETNKPRYEP